MVTAVRGTFGVGLGRQGGRRALTRACALVAAAVAVAACGGGSGAGAGAGTEGTTDFAAAYQAVSEDFETQTAEVKQAGAAALDSGDSAGVTDVYRQLRDVTAAAADDYRQLQAPPELTEALDQVVNRLEEQVAALDKVLSATQQQDSAAVGQGLQEFAAAVAAWGDAHRSLTEQLGSTSSG